MSAPNRATPITLPTWRVVLSTLEATPDRLGPTVADKAEVIGGTVKPIPVPSITICHHRLAYGVLAVMAYRNKHPAAKAA